MKVRDILKRLEADGGRQVRMWGSHRQFHHPDKPGTVTVAGHLSEEPPPATRESIWRQAQLEDQPLKEYLVIFERGEKSWGAYVPDLPGCIATARTREETTRLIREAIAFHLEGMRLHGEVIPEPTTEAEKIVVAA